MKVLYWVLSKEFAKTVISIVSNEQSWCLRSLLFVQPFFVVTQFWLLLFFLSLFVPLLVFLSSSTVFCSSLCHLFSLSCVLLSALPLSRTQHSPTFSAAPYPSLCDKHHSVFPPCTLCVHGRTPLLRSPGFLSLVNEVTAESTVHCWVLCLRMFLIVVVGHRGLGNNEENIPKIEMTLTTDLTSAMTWMDGSNFLRSYDGSLGRIQSKGHQLRITEIHPYQVL